MFLSPSPFPFFNKNIYQNNNKPHRVLWPLPSRGTAWGRSATFSHPDICSWNAALPNWGNFRTQAWNQTAKHTSCRFAKNTAERKEVYISPQKRESNMSTRELACTEHLKYTGPWVAHFYLFLREAWEVGVRNRILKLRNQSLGRKVPNPLRWEVADLGIVMAIKC